LFVAGSLDDLLPADSIARAIWAGLEQLDFEAYDGLYRMTRRGILRWTRAGAEEELLWRQFVHNLMLLTGIWKPMVPTKTG
jgi:hypothetical protein